MVGRKFKYVQVSREDKAAEVADAPASPVHGAGRLEGAPRIRHAVPLAADLDERRFKCLYMDVGLMCAALHLDVLDLAEAGPDSRERRARWPSRSPCQLLLYGGPRCEMPVLYYWTREARNAAAEVDYLVAPARRVVPVEIKAGTTESIRTVHQFLKEKRLRLRRSGSTPTCRACCGTRRRAARLRRGSTTTC